MRYSVAVIAFGLILTATPALAVRAYVLAQHEPTADDAKVREALNGSLQNCKQLLAGIYPQETMIHLECTTTDDVNIALTEFAKATGVARVTVLTLAK